MTIEQHLVSEGKTDTWLGIAQKFNFSPELTDKQRADKVRKLHNSLSKIQIGDPNNVLVIGDLHIPFELKGYLEFCKEQQIRFNCGKVIFIGDIIDNHFASYHETYSEGYSAGQELELAIDHLKQWYKAFPEAEVCVGNHDRMTYRKGNTSGISQRWLKPYSEVLEVPNWKFVDEVEYNNVLYVHGEQGQASTKAANEFKSVVCGHHHTEGYVKLYNGGKNFAMQVGTGINFESYAFAYAQRGKKPILSCGVVLNQSPIIIPFV